METLDATMAGTCSPEKGAEERLRSLPKRRAVGGAVAQVHMHLAKLKVDCTGAHASGKDGCAPVLLRRERINKAPTSSGSQPGFLQDSRSVLSDISFSCK